MKPLRSAVKPAKPATAHDVGRVFLVGAGPGAPDLITLRGAAVMGRADVIVYDALVSPEILRLAPARAERIFAGKKGGEERSVEQAEINRILIAQARAGRRVVRLKGGDPFIFGRGGEEAEALVAAGIAFEVVPGVTSATAAPAFAGIPLTHREHGSFVAFITGHQDSTKDADAAIPWDDLARAARGRGTLVILMATARMGAHLARLAAAGLGAETPAAAIQWGTTAAQKTVVATLGTLTDEVARAGLKAPAVIVVGECAALGRELNWFEAMPLFGRRIVITRASHDASDFAARIRALGGEAIEFPTIETAPPSSYEILDRAIAEIGSFDWIIFSSANGVDRFVDRMRINARDLREMGRAAIAAIGPITADRVRHYALTVAAMPAEYRAEAVVERDRHRAHRGCAHPDSAGRSRAGSAARNVAAAWCARGRGRAHLSHGDSRECGGGRRTHARADCGPPERSRDLHEFQHRHEFRRDDRRHRPRASRPPRSDRLPPRPRAELGFDVVVAPTVYTVDALIAAITEYYAGARANLARSGFKGSRIVYIIDRESRRRRFEFRARG